MSERTTKSKTKLDSREMDEKDTDMDCGQCGAVQLRHKDHENRIKLEAFGMCKNGENQRNGTSLVEAVSAGTLSRQHLGGFYRF